MLELYTKDGCPVCNQTKQYLISNNIDYTEYKIGQNIERSQVLAKFPNAKVVPIIVVDGKEVNGISELKLLTEG